MSSPESSSSTVGNQWQSNENASENETKLKFEHPRFWTVVFQFTQSVWSWLVSKTTDVLHRVLRSQVLHHWLRRYSRIRHTENNVFSCSDFVTENDV